MAKKIEENLEVNSNLFKLVSCFNEGNKNTTIKACQTGGGCIILTTTVICDEEEKNKTISESLCFAPSVRIKPNGSFYELV